MSEAQILKPFGEYKTPGVDDDVVEALERTLERAKAGEIIGVAIASYTVNNRASYVFRSGKAGMMAMLGCVDCLKDDMLAASRE